MVNSTSYLLHLVTYFSFSFKAFLSFTSIIAKFLAATMQWRMEIADFTTATGAEMYAIKKNSGTPNTAMLQKIINKFHFKGCLETYLLDHL